MTATVDAPASSPSLGANAPTVGVAVAATFTAEEIGRAHV